MTSVFVEEVIWNIIQENSEIAAVSIVTTDSATYDASFSTNLADSILTNEKDRETVSKFVDQVVDTSGISKTTLTVGIACSRNLAIRDFKGRLSRHNHMNTSMLVERDDWKNIGQKILLEQSDALIALSSKVLISNHDYRHIPMIDFACPISENNNNNIRFMMRTLNQSGYLIDSGKSYHFYGRKLLDFEAYIKLLGLTLLYAPLVDVAWVAHQMIGGAAALRLSGKSNYRHRPRLLFHF